ncbi:hypothetical protein NOU13_28080 [Rhodococcus erythropolis]|uniref:hypothetical protein n=1 Tax=Rhodococcus erythropolis TaxID=1833 RepID=UPI0021088384|nr:hypothetical protein [Rhodococcus erythropolis]MCQ4128365.1 hypothetical protein [Rhodococcus erythropolis]
MLLTTTQAADEIATGLRHGADEPSVFPDKVVSLAHAHRLTNKGSGARYMFDQTEVEAFVTDTRFVPDLDEVRQLHPAGEVYRVSVKPRETRSSPFTVRGSVYKWIGVDFADDPSCDDELGGWSGVWPVNHNVVRDLVANEALVYASMRDYIGRGHMRTIVDVEPVGDRYFFVTRPASEEVCDWLGAGAWIKTPGGPISALL